MKVRISYGWALSLCRCSTATHSGRSDHPGFGAPGRWDRSRAPVQKSPLMSLATETGPASGCPSRRTTPSCAPCSHSSPFLGVVLEIAVQGWSRVCQKGEAPHLSRPGADYLDRVRAYHKPDTYDKAMRKRQTCAELPLAKTKLWPGMRRLWLRTVRERWRRHPDSRSQAVGHESTCRGAP